MSQKLKTIALTLTALAMLISVGCFGHELASAYRDNIVSACRSAAVEIREKAEEMKKDITEWLTGGEYT